MIEPTIWKTVRKVKVWENETVIRTNLHLSKMIVEVTAYKEDISVTYWISGIPHRSSCKNLHEGFIFLKQCNSLIRKLKHDKKV